MFGAVLKRIVGETSVRRSSGNPPSDAKKLIVGFMKYGNDDLDIIIGRHTSMRDYVTFKIGKQFFSAGIWK